MIGELKKSIKISYVTTIRLSINADSQSSVNNSLK